MSDITCEKHKVARGTECSLCFKELEQRIAELEQKYNDLIMCVATKYPNESRHETAKRYILTCEMPNEAQAQEEDKPPPG